MKHTLNGRPVFAGTKLTYIDQDHNEMWGDDYIVVTEISGSSLEYEGNAGEVSGTISIKQLPNVFKHYEEKEEVSNVYELAYIADLMSIPDDRLDECLDDLKGAIRTLRLGVVTATINEEETNNSKFNDADRKLYARQLFPNIQWVDDGKQTNEIRSEGETVLKIIST